MSRDTGVSNFRHYHVVRDGRVESRPWQRWDLAWAAIAKRARYETETAWRVRPCRSGCRV